MPRSRRTYEPGQRPTCRPALADAGIAEVGTAEHADSDRRRRPRPEPYSVQTPMPQRLPHVHSRRSGTVLNQVARRLRKARTDRYARDFLPQLESALHPHGAT